MKTVLANPSWHDIEKGCAELVLRMVTTKAVHSGTSLVGLTRGGLVPLVVISHMLEKADINVTVTPVSYSSKGGRGDDKSYNNMLPQLESKYVVLIDDIVDSGHTMKEVYDTYAQFGHVVSVASLYYKEGAVIVPDYYWQKVDVNSPWIIFPWE